MFDLRIWIGQMPTFEWHLLELHCNSIWSTDLHFLAVERHCKHTFKFSSRTLPHMFYEGAIISKEIFLSLD